MDKLIAFAVALIICFGLYSIVDYNYDRKIEQLAAQNQTFEGSNKSLSNYNMTKKILNKSDNKNNMLIMGSSELSPCNIKSFPIEVFNYENSPLTVTLFGEGGYQSITHTIALGAMDQEIKNNKVVFIVSPQWFNESGSARFFSSVYSESLMEKFIDNDRIPAETKNKIIARTKELLKGHKNMLYTIERFEREHSKKAERANQDAGESKPTNTAASEKLSEPPLAIAFEDKLAEATTGIKNAFFGLKEKKELINSYKPTMAMEKPAADTPDFNKLMAEAEQHGKESCTNNPFYIDDDYFTKYMKDTYKTHKNTSKGYIKDSPEFSDLQLYLDLAKALNKQIMLVNFPMNGYWYDYDGYNQKQRAAYYQRIRQIASDNHIKMLDLTDKEYEKYVLRDYMHVGWKGYVYINEAIANFAKE